MDIKIENKAGTVKPGNVREYRKNPSNLNLAAQAAAHYAGKSNQRMIVIQGNSYMNKVYHIAKECDPISKYTAMQGMFKVVIVEPTGECFYGTAQ
jgi:hypothetical protein